LLPILFTIVTDFVIASSPVTGFGASTIIAHLPFFFILLYHLFIAFLIFLYMIMM